MARSERLAGIGIDDLRKSYEHGKAHDAVMEQFGPKEDTAVQDEFGEVDRGSAPALETAWFRINEIERDRGCIHRE